MEDLISLRLPLGFVRTRLDAFAPIRVQTTIKVALAFARIFGTFGGVASLEGVALVPRGHALPVSHRAHRSHLR